MAHIGTPMMNLKAQGVKMYGNRKQARYGNSGPLRAILKEALDERHSADPDFDSSKKHLNDIHTYFDGAPNVFRNEKGVYVPQSEIEKWRSWQFDVDDNGFFSDEEAEELNSQFTGEVVSNSIESLFKKHKVKCVSKNGKEFYKKPRKDTTLAVAGIFKPEFEFMDVLSDVQKQNLFDDLEYLLSEKCSEMGVKMLYFTIHRDEMNEHAHYCFYDDDFQIADKLAIGNFKKWLNEGLQDELNALGWDCFEHNDKSQPPKVPNLPLNASSREYKKAVRVQELDFQLKELTRAINEQDQEALEAYFRAKGMDEYER